MSDYNTNYEIAQQISERIGTSPIPFNSVYSLCLQIYQELGGTQETFDDIYDILLEILPLTNLIDDSTTSTNKTWSSNKISSELSGKQDAFSEGVNIEIRNDIISAVGYTYNGTNKSFNAGTLTKDNVTPGYASFAANNKTTASGTNAFATGYETTASGNQSHTEGTETVASSANTHAEGYGSQATLNGAHAEGDLTVASGRYSHTEGEYTQATNRHEHAEGVANLSNNGTIHSIGIGDVNYSTDVVNSRKNAVEVMSDGSVYIYGVGSYNGTNPANASTLQDVVNNLKTVSIKLHTGTVKTYQVKEGMTWFDWINSNYNEDGFVYKKFSADGFLGYAIFEGANSYYHLGAIIGGVEEGDYVSASCTISTSLQYHFYD